MSRFRRLLLLIAGAGVGLAVACSAGEDGGPTGTPRPTLTLAPLSPVETFAPEFGPVPELTQEQRDLTEKIVQSDPSVQALADGSPLFFESIGPVIVSVPDREGWVQVVGTFARVKLGRPHDVESVEIPQYISRHYYEFWPPDLQSRYTGWSERTEVVSVSNLNDFDVQVDLARRRVLRVGISYSGGSDVNVVVQPSLDLPDVGEQIQLIDEAREYAGEIASIAEDDPEIQAILDALVDEEDPQGGLIEQIGDHRFGRYSIYAHQVVTVEGRFPVIVDQDPVTGDYRSELIDVSRDSTNEVYVTVDMDLRKVIDIDTHEQTDVCFTTDCLLQRRTGAAQRIHGLGLGVCVG